MPPKPSAIGALKKRPYTPRPVNPVYDGSDIDSLIADTKGFLGDMPEGTGSKANTSRLNDLLADMDASDLRYDALQRQRPEGLRIGAAGAVAKSAAVPIRVLSQFGGPALGFAGEGIAQGLDALAMLDGAPVPQGSMAGDITKSLGKAATATAFGALNNKVGPLSALAQRTGTSLASRIGVGAAAGAAEGVGLNVAQGALTRGFDEGSLDAAFDKDGMLLDAGLGGGIGAAGGAALGALGARAARGTRELPTLPDGEYILPNAGGSTTVRIGRGGGQPKPMPQEYLDALGASMGVGSVAPNRPVQQPQRAPWQDETDAAFDAQGSGWMNRTFTDGNVRGPATRQRVSVTAVPQGVKGLLGPATSQHQLGMDPARFEMVDPANTYQGPANPKGMPPGVPEPRGLDAPPTPEELAEFATPAPVAEPLPAPTGPEVPQGRFPAGDPTAAAAEPYTMPTRSFPAIDEAKRIAMLETPPTMDELNAFTLREAADPSADVSMQRPPVGPPADEPFDVPTPGIKDKGLADMFGKPERMTSDGKTVSIRFAGKKDPFVVPIEALANVSPELDAIAQRFRRTPPQGDPSLTITPRPGRPTPEAPAAPAVGPNEADLAAVSSERAAAGIEDEYGAFAEGDLERMFGMESPAPGILAEPGTTFAPDPTPPLNVAADEVADVDIEALLRMADEQDAAAAPQEPTVQVLDPDDATTQNNASGESGASTEAINRQRSLAAQGRTRVMLDRAGRETPIIGADGVDVQPKPGQTHAIRNADGSYEVVTDNGGKVPTAKPVAKAEVAPTRVNGAEPADPLDEVFDLGGTSGGEPPQSAASPTESSLEGPGSVPARPAAATAPDAAAAEGLTLNDGDQPGTMNQAGKFVPIGDDSWRTLDVAKNKSVVIRRADGTVQVVTDNGGKVPKKWDAEKWGVKQEQQKAKEAARAEREAAAAAKKAAAAKPAAAETPAPQEPPQAEYQPPMTADEASGDALPPGATTAPETPAAPAPVMPRAIKKTKFGDRDAVEVYFDTKASDEVRKALGEYGFRYLSRDRKWAFNIPKGSKITPDEVEAAVQAITRGESVESVQKAINLDAGQQKAAANAVTEGRWAPEPTATVLRDRDLSPDAAAREVRRTALRQLGWTPGKEGDRRIWTKPADGMRGDLELRGSAPEVPPANPPQAEVLSEPSASAATPNSTTPSESGTSSSSASTTETPRPTTSSDATQTGSAAAPSDYTKVDPLDIKVDAKGYQFKGDTDARGRSEKLKGVEEWDEEQSILSPVLLHRRLDGSLYVVDGHQRVGLAQDLKRAGKDVPDLNARVLNEADGVTVERARRRGAMSNVMLNTADPRDIARVLREGDLTPLEQKRIGRIQKDAGEKFRQGRDIAALSDKAFDYYLNADIDPRFARMVSTYRPELQEGLLQQLDRNKPRTNSEAEAILAQAAEMKSAGVQTDMFGNTTVDNSFKELVQFKERVLGTFRTNRRLFGKAGSAADTLESAGQTKIDREAAGKVASDAGRAEELWSKFSNAQGSYTRKAIQEAFDDYKAGRLSFGKATERIAEALDADYTGRPSSGPGGGSGDGLNRAGRGEESGAGDEAVGELFDGGLFDNRAVEAGAKDGAIEDGADDILDAMKRFLGDERGAVNVKDIGEGLAGLEKLVKDNPRFFWTALRAGGGGFLGSLTHDDEDASMLDNVLFGAVAGAASPRFAGASWRALKKAAPVVHREVREALTGRVYGRGPINPRGVPMARKPPDVTKDISGWAKVMWSPDKVVPDVWAHVQPIMRSLYELEAPAKGLTGDQLALARRAQVSEAMSYMRGAATKSRDAGHRKRAEFIEGLMADLTGDPTVPEQFLSDMTNGKITPKQVRKVMTASTNAIYHSLLGWNVASGLANMTQVAFNYPVLGAKATVKGILKGYSKQGRADLAFLNLNRRPMGHSEEIAMHKWVEKYLDWSQTPMRFSDSGNRRATYAGAMEYATARGFAKDQATQFADELVGQTQGIAGDLGSNPFHRNLGPLRVFTKYPLIWGSMMQDFATHPDPAVKRRFYGMMTGIFAASALSGIQLTNFFIPRAGIVPGVGATMDIGQHLFGAPDHDFEEHFEFRGTEDVVTPGYINKGLNAMGRFNEKGLGNRNIIGRKGQVLRSISAAEDLGSLLGIETKDRADTRSEESAMYDKATSTKREESIRSRRIRREAGEKLEAGDRAGASKALKALSQRQRNEFKKERLRTARERARRLVPLRRRDEFDSEFKER